MDTLTAPEPTLWEAYVTCRRRGMTAGQARAALTLTVATAGLLAALYARGGDL